MIKSIIITGMGGQGVTWLSNVIRKAAGRKYKAFTGSDNRGGAQRFGHVSSIIRFRVQKHTESSLNRAAVLLGVAIDVPDKKADYIISLEASEALNFNSKTGIETRLFINNYLLAPTNIRREDKEYFAISDLERHYRGLTPFVTIMDFNKQALEATGAVVNANIFMLACFITSCPELFSPEDFVNTMNKKRFDILENACSAMKDLKGIKK